MLVVLVVVVDVVTRENNDGGGDVVEQALRCCAISCLFVFFVYLFSSAGCRRWCWCIYWIHSFLYHYHSYYFHHYHLISWLGPTVDAAAVIISITSITSSLLSIFNYYFFFLCSRLQTSGPTFFFRVCNSFFITPKHKKPHLPPTVSVSVLHYF